MQTQSQLRRQASHSRYQSDLVSLLNWAPSRNAPAHINGSTCLSSSVRLLPLFRLLSGPSLYLWANRHSFTMASGGSVSGGKACKCQTTSASSKASLKDDPESELESEPPSESELSMDDMPVSVSSTAANNKKIVADLRSSLIADTSAYESAKKESLKTFRPKEVRYSLF